MSKSPRKMLNEFMSGVQAVSKTNGKEMKAFMNFLGETSKEGEIDVKTKELISLGIAVFSRCEYCIVFHVYNALKAGATPEEIMESAIVATGFGGGPAVAYSVTLLKDSIDEFKKDFEK
ncbi:alkylhydroperoxidase AhpD family core domain protein [Clostridium argentinense CDC 2741]|uniref:Alkylhydroperoxidase AhpD family core domain protein n=1 Tax=Clostridium argentinense CDC 2741 TaxID=1418104 RepID=A0A0C1R3T7_9CLOT|nr:carboxymuconolactone decarboxylase family protein [Clostridium argentinense]ARC84144.1 4-carboxymuconolactone decarboxylase [Clostridium argentinense]KIE45131.1 alkylhydroperoxidase AhpD family core domain protein [Clostridium argentinense CDC 2741]NFF38088.1 carboxymuconolactone decarboxylase family protein [Clostridium argentinense]NFP51247.1 carboxymuconolactone decarboxylase family protein [Clostridium argentinense]NFP73820.1 carboxymuconolactone decarboxylase family protein [Clostridiu